MIKLPAINKVHRKIQLQKLTQKLGKSYFFYQ